ncbi:hypothetical protein G7D34_003711 [Salmonella enterica]|nr:hypothetical protein [Salmonella enterica]
MDIDPNLSKEERRKLMAKIYYQNNKQKIAERQLKYRTENKSKYQEYWKKRNTEKREYVNANRAKRRNQESNATFLKGDEWNDFVISELRELAQIRDQETGIKWHVDHIVPVLGELVSGLHVWYNLQLIPAKMNLQKQNSFTVH